MTVDRGPKGLVFLERYLDLAQSAPREGQHAALATTVADLAQLWDCSERSARQTLGRLGMWGLLTWHPRPGRARRSEVVLHGHPVHVYYERACRAEAAGSFAEAGFWLGASRALSQPSGVGPVLCAHGSGAVKAPARARTGFVPPPR